MNELDTIDIRTGKPFAGLQKTREHRSTPGESIAGSWGRARGLMGGAFMGVMLAQQSSFPLPYDAEVEWVGGDNETFTYFDTGVTTHQLGRVVVRFIMPTVDEVPNYHYLNTSILSTYSIQDFMVHYLSRRRFRPWLYKVEVSSSFFIDDGEVHEYDCSTTSAYIDGRLMRSYEYPHMGVKDENVCILARSLYKSCARVCSLKLYDTSSNLVREMFAVRVTNDSGQREGAFFDRVSQEVIRQTGTGRLLIGPDKP